MDIVRKFATCTVQPGEHYAGDFIVEYAQALLKAEDKLAKTTAFVEDRVHNRLNPEPSMRELLDIIEKD